MVESKSNKVILLLLKAEYFYLTISLVFGLFIISITPPFQSPDESNHFHRASSIAYGKLYSEKRINRLGNELPEVFLVYSQNYDHVRKSDDNKVSNIKSDSYESIADSKKVFIDIANVGYYSPTVYIPQSIALSIARVLSNDISFHLYLGRLFSLISWVLLGFLTIKFSGKYKELMMVLMLLPSSVFINVMLNGDSFTNALSFLSIGLILFQISEKKQMSIRLLGILFLTLLFISVNKPSLYPLSFLILIIDKKKILFERWGQIGIIAFIIIITVLSSFHSKSLFIPYDSYHAEFRDNQQLNSGVDPDDQMAFVLSNPAKFAKILAVSYLESFKATTAHYIGKFGWEKNYLPWWLMAMLLLLLIANMLSVETHLSKPKRYLLALIFLACFLAFSILIYAQWSPVGNDRILSLSGRYFIPFAPLLIIGLANNYFQDYNKTIVRINRVIIPLALMILILSIQLRYY